MSTKLDEMFSVQTSETTGEVSPYSDLLDRVVDSCPEATVVRESQQWSKTAAIELGNTTIHAAKDCRDNLPFDPTKTSQWIVYYWNHAVYDLAWIATWPVEDDD